MSGPKWTPGPWRYGEVSPYEEDAREISIMATNPRTKGPYCVAVAIPCGAGRSDRYLAPEMTEADAHLIAAAPELYEALILAEGHLADELVLNNTTIHPIGDCLVLRRVRSALAKARGAQ